MAHLIPGQRNCAPDLSLTIGRIEADCFNKDSQYGCAMVPMFTRYFISRLTVTLVLPSHLCYGLIRYDLHSEHTHHLARNVDSTVRSRHAHRPRINVTSNHTLSIRPIVRNSANLKVVTGGIIRGVERDIALGMAVCSRHGVGSAIEVVHVGVGVVEDLVVVDVVAVDCSAGTVDRYLAGAAAAVGVRGLSFDFAAGYAVVLAELGGGLDG